MYLCKLTNQILIIISNLCHENKGARKEVLKCQFLARLAKYMNHPLFVTNEEFLDCAAWFLSVISNQYENTFDNQVEDEYLIPFLVRMLYLPENNSNMPIINNSINTIINLTDVKGSSRCNKMFI